MDTSKQLQEITKKWLEKRGNGAGKHIEPDFKNVWLDGSFDLEELTTLSFEAGKVETEKAFGACKNCYGKGYSTVKQVASSRYGIWEMEPVKPCSCDRGKQITEILENKNKETLAMVLKEIEGMKETMSICSAHQEWDIKCNICKTTEPYRDILDTLKTKLTAKE